jgi:hypothetical protein
MAKRLANDRRLWVESATPGTFNMVKGNQNLSISRSGGTIDGTSKDDFPFMINLPGPRNLSLGASFIPDLPDVNGFERLQTVARATTVTPINIQVRKGGAAGVAPGDVEFECSMYVTDDNMDAGQGKVIDNSFVFVPAAAPTVDALK